MSIASRYTEAAVACEYLADLYQKAHYEMGEKPAKPNLCAPMTLPQKMRMHTYYMRAHAIFCDVVAEVYQKALAEGEGFFSGVIKADYEVQEEGDPEDSGFRMPTVDDMRDALLSSDPATCAGLIRKRAKAYKDLAEDYRARAEFHAK